MADGRACAPLEDFPLLAAHAAGGPPLAYLDNAATTQKPSCVLDAMDDFYRTACGNPHRSAHALAAAATRVYEDARSTVARFIGASPEETAFTSGATHALNTVALCYCAERLEPGDEIALTLLEHHSNLVPWQTAARLSRARLSFIVPDRDGVVSDDEIDRAIGPRTRVVAFTGMSNVLGTVPPVKRIIEAAHACGAVAVLDCAQSIAHEPLDVHDLDVDFAAFSGHKLYGPMGIGVLYGKRRLLEETPPLLRGGGMVEAVFERASSFDGTPGRFEAGTQNVAGAAGLAEAVRYLDRIGFDAVRAHERELTRALVSGLDSIPSVRLYGPGPNAETPRGGIVSFNVKGVGAAEVAHVLDRRGGGSARRRPLRPAPPAPHRRGSRLPRQHSRLHHHARHRPPPRSRGVVPQRSRSPGNIAHAVKQTVRALPTSGKARTAAPTLTPHGILRLATLAQDDKRAQTPRSNPPNEREAQAAAPCGRAGRPTKRVPQVEPFQRTGS